VFLQGCTFGGAVGVPIFSVDAWAGGDALLRQRKSIFRNFVGYVVLTV